MIKKLVNGVWHHTTTRCSSNMLQTSYQLNYHDTFLYPFTE